MIRTPHTCTCRQTGARRTTQPAHTHMQAVTTATSTTTTSSTTTTITTTHCQVRARRMWLVYLCGFEGSILCTNVCSSVLL